MEESVKRTRSAAKSRHKHELYELSVQNVPFEVQFLRRVYRRLRGKEPLRLREDFCGTALLCCEWARKVPNGRAQGVDLDLPTLEWGREHNLARLSSEERDRVELLRANVLDAKGFRPDIVVAFNFSYFVFKVRRDLLEYFRRVRRALAPGGIFVFDIYGGAEAQRPQEERKNIGEFEYVWEQAKYNPITGDYVCHIHFDFPDGSRNVRVFSYAWRLWSLPEVLDIVEDAGFARPTVYWEGTGSKGGGNGVYRPSTRGDDALAWVAYVVAPT
jgi:SAM-dependent methyltransferase